MRKDVRNRIRVGLLIGAVAAVLGSAGLTWRHVANGRWRAALVEVRALELRLDAKVVHRQALWGDTTDERAQPHYDRALSLVAAWDSETVSTAWQAEDERARDSRRALVSEGSEALEALHRGAHAADATQTVDWSLGFEHPFRKLMPPLYLMKLCEMKVAILLADGRELEAVGVALDALQFAGDLSQGPILIEEMIGAGLLSPEVVVAGVADGTLLALSGDARERLVSGVSALDRRLSWRMAALEPELVLTARGLDRVLQDGGSGLLGGLPGLMHAGPGLTRGRMFAAEYVNTMRGICADFDRAYRAGPGALFDEIGRFPEQSDEWENPISAMELPRLDSHYKGRLFSMGRFKLIAHAISAAEQPQDPWLAEYMREETTEEGTRLWLDHEIFGELEIHVGTGAEPREVTHR